MALPFRVRLVGATNSQLGEAPISSLNQVLKSFFWPWLPCGEESASSGAF
jgi:hypothetical protein